MGRRKPRKPNKVEARDFAKYLGLPVGGDAAEGISTMLNLWLFKYFPGVEKTRHFVPKSDYDVMWLINAALLRSHLIFELCLEMHRKLNPGYCEAERSSPRNPRPIKHDTRGRKPK